MAGAKLRKWVDRLKAKRPKVVANLRVKHGLDMIGLSNGQIVHQDTARRLKLERG